MHLIDRARTYIESTFSRPLGERMLRCILARVLPYPRVFGAAMRLGGSRGLFGSLLPKRLPTCWSCSRRGPRRISLRRRSFRQKARGDCVWHCWPVARSRRWMARSMLPPSACCTAWLRGRDRGGSGCCGSLHCIWAVRKKAGRSRARISASWALVQAARCDGRECVGLRHDGQGLRPSVRARARQARRLQIAALARDVTEFLCALGLQALDERQIYRVAYHDACSLQHGQNVIDSRRASCAPAGFEVVDVPERHFCCGSAGTYNLLQPEIAETLGQRKAAHIRTTDPDIVAAGNLGCMVQIGRYTEFRWCTPSSCSTGQPAGRCRPPWGA